MTVAEFIEEYRISRATLYRWIKVGRLHGGNGVRRIAGRLRIDRGLFEKSLVKLGELVFAFMLRGGGIGLATMILHHFAHGYLRGRLV